MKDAPRLLKIPKSECPDVWIRLPRHEWPKSWSNIEDPLAPLERNLRTLSTNTEKCSSHEFLQWHMKNCQGGRNLTQERSRGPTTRKDTRKNALEDLVNWQTKRQSNNTQFQLLASVTTISRRKSWKRLEN